MLSECFMFCVTFLKFKSDRDAFGEMKIYVIVLDQFILCEESYIG
jgi:hypothetical protein